MAPTATETAGAAAAAAAAPAAAAASATIDGVEVRDDPAFGRCAFATRPFAAGEIIVNEAPLVCCFEAGGPGADPAAAGAAASRDKAKSAWLSRAMGADVAAVRAACQASGGAAAPPDLRRLCVCYLAFCAAPPEARARVLADVMNEAPAEAGDTMVVKRARAAAAYIAAEIAPRAAKADAAADGAAFADPPQDAATIERVLLAFELNAHAVNGAGALFAVGSKFTHTCGQPNSIFKSCGGRGYHVALRDIAAGELLTTTYLEGGAMLMSKQYREVFTMEGFAFKCRCARCAAPADDMRRLPCPECAAAAARRGGDGLLPKQVALGRLQPSGYITFTASVVDGDGSGADGGADAAAADAPPPRWDCAACGASLPDADAALFGAGGDRIAEIAALAPGGRAERGAAALVHQADREMRSGRAPRAAVARLAETVARAVGPAHWATAAVLRGHSELLVAELSTAPAAGGGAGAAAAAALEELQAEWRRRCAFVDGVPGLEAARALFQELAAHATALYHLYAPLSKALGARHPAVARLLALAAELRARMAPALAVFGPAGWPLPEPLGIVAALEAGVAAARAAGADVDAAGAGGGDAGGCGGEGLDSMQQLRDFLPSGGGGKSSGGGGGGSKKKKAGGKKK